MRTQNIIMCFLDDFIIAILNTQYSYSICAQCPIVRWNTSLVFHNRKLDKTVRIRMFLFPPFCPVSHSIYAWLKANDIKYNTMEAAHRCYLKTTRIIDFSFDRCIYEANRININNSNWRYHFISDFLMYLFITFLMSQQWFDTK